MSFTSFLLEQFRKKHELESEIIDAISMGSLMPCCGIFLNLANAELEGNYKYQDGTASFVIPFEAEYGGNSFDENSSGEIRVDVKFERMGRKIYFEITSYDVINKILEAA